MITYIKIDLTNDTKSVVQFENVNIEFWYKLFDSYSQEEVEAYIKAEARLVIGDIEGAVEIATPFVSGENTIEIVNVEDEFGVLTTVVNGSDSRSLLKHWCDEKGLQI